ncbi:HAUS augmin-like complex subunit 5 [Sardina pilchardus]|uniref:HAUS augmin-like complex subunit 5 n=1 Tax=Sardina pilchardus TaxID=27697 RepID=UPI002E115C57
MVDRDLKRWAIKEFNYPSNKLPPDRCLRKFCAGQRSSIWKYVTQHVFKEKKVEIRRRNVNWYKRLEDDELKKVESLRKREILKEITELKAQIHKQDISLKEAEEDLQRNERACSVSWARHEERGRRELLLWSYLQRCGDVRRSLTDDTQPIREQRRALEEHLSKGEVELSFHLSGAGHGLNVEPLVMHEVRKLCEDRVRYLKSVQAQADADDQKSTAAACADHPSPAEREAAYKDWLTAVKVFLQTHPPRHVLASLHVLAHQQAGPEEALSGRRSPEEQNTEENRPSLKTLFQLAWVEAEECVVELTRTRCRTQELRNDIRVLLNEETMLEDQDQLKHAALSRRLQCVCRAAERRSVQEQCVHMEAQTRLTERHTHTLRQQHSSIMGLRRAVVTRQKNVQDLITGISITQRELVHMRAEIRQFLSSSLLPLYEQIVELTGALCSQVLVEARQFGSVPMTALDCRELSGGQKVPACQLSIYRINTPRFLKLCSSLGFPLYKNPAELLSHVVLQRVELRRRRNALLLLSSSTAAVRKAIAQLPAPDTQALMERVRSVDDDLQRVLLPRATEALQHCNKGLDSCGQVRTAITHWWEQPAQFALPDECVEGKSFLQWLYRWKRATKKHDV